MTIDFNDKTHTYYVDGDVAAISVTELLQKHGIAEGFSAVPQKTLKKKAQFGKAVHKDIENIIYGAYPKTFQGQMFHEWALKMGKIKNLDDEFEYTGAERFYCFHYNADKMTVIPLEKVPDTEIERLLEAEANGQIYKKPELVVADDFRLKVEQAESLLMRIEQARESALETAEERNEL